MDRYLKGFESFNLPVQPGDLSPLVLAYVGDACFELYIRSRVVAENPKLPPQKLHRLTVGYVSASSQSDIIHGIWEHLNENEMTVVKKGRNAKSGTSPKNADVVHHYGRRIHYNLFPGRTDF